MLLGIIIFPLSTRFSLICSEWAFPIIHVVSLWGEWTGLSLWASARDLSVSLGWSLLWACTPILQTLSFTFTIAKVEQNSFSYK